MCDQIVNLVEQVKAGSIKAYAVAIPERSPALPDVPTTKEAGLPEYQVSAWNALFAPKGTPTEITAKLNEALVKALDGSRPPASACSISAPCCPRAPSAPATASRPSSRRKSPGGTRCSRALARLRGDLTAGCG